MAVGMYIDVCSTCTEHVHVCIMWDGVGGVICRDEVMLCSTICTCAEHVCIMWDVRWGGVGWGEVR